ncbi:Cof-type HAD-IIB family hydrolase [Tepidibacter mesophilus]|uniref:Cof-type HAD-IIB family hydrolase n=1 Tax=Tepidibacter mesophilus TaxID=655607 RepID=UPI001650FDDA|nr:Cof-type HAD-IIB family hydrolase [Tepidibacter mesophilus]
MGYKAIISDLDGTLLNSNHRVSEYTKSVIEKVVKKGIKFFIATGRHHKDASHIKEQLNLDTVLITSNGSRAHNFKNEKLLCHNIDSEISKSILKMKFDEDIHVNVYQEDHWLVEKENEWLGDFNDESSFMYKMVDFKNLDSYECIKFFFICNDGNKLKLVKEEIESKFSDYVHATFSLPICLEVMAKGVSKGAALEEILKDYGISSNEVIAFGDGFNDFEMLSSVGKGLVMGNADENLKKALPDNDIIKTNNEDGVAKYIEGLFL